MLNYQDIKQNKEISRLIQYGYDLHKREMEHYVFSIPNFEFYNGNSCPMKKVSGGGIFGKRSYPNHSFSYLCTTLGVTVGKTTENGFQLEYAQMFQTNNDDFEVNISNLKISNNDNQWYTTLDYDRNNDWDHMQDEDKQELFIKTMEFIGFKKDDILGVLNGTLTAREAYMNVAPEDIKNLQWVSKNRRMFVFDGNIAIEGNFGSMNMDRFPFPFQEQPILDCSKVKTSCIHFENNYRRVKLINVNSNPNSITYTNLKNAIVEEPIDLSLVDASGTKFGHHKVINLEYSIAKLSNVDLTLAVNENGERYIINEKGMVEFDEEDYPKTISTNENQSTNIEVFANADNLDMVNTALDYETDGIGLVRTEHIFTNLKDVKIMIELLDYPNKEDEIEYLKRLKELQRKQAKDILLNCNNKQVIFRLLDFKLKEYLKTFGLTIDYDDDYIECLRGAQILDNHRKILTTQIEAIFETAQELDKEVSILIPFMKYSYTFTNIKKEIDLIAKQYNLKNLKIGAMIENIEICNDADELAKEANFISIGTNDLTESITKLSRDTNSIEFQELTNEVKSAIEETIYRARSTNPSITIGICGEHSNYIENLKFYSNIGINYITCNPDFINQNKEFIYNNLQAKIKKRKK